MKKMLCAALALLLTLSLLPASWAAEPEAPFDTPRMGLGFSLRDFVDWEKGTLTIAGSAIDLDHVCFLDSCEVGDELDICLARAKKTAFAMDPTTLPDGCTVELRDEPPEDFVIGGREIPEAERPDPQEKAIYLYLTGKPTKEGNYMFFFFADEIYFGNIEVYPATEKTDLFLSEPEATEPPASYTWESEPFLIPTSEPVYIPSVTEEPFYIPPADPTPTPYIPTPTPYVPTPTPYVPTPTPYIPTPTPYIPTPAPTPYVAPTITITGDTYCRPGDEVLLEARVANAAGATVTYQWYGRMGAYTAPIQGATGVYYQPDTSRAGTWSYYCVATVYLNGYSGSIQSDSMTLTVATPSVVAVQLAQMPAKTSYTTGEQLDTRGLSLYVRYDDGSYELVSDGFTAYPTRFDQPGTQVVWVTYGDKSVSFDVSVREAAQTLRGVGVLTLPNKTSYKVGESLDTTGLSLRVYFTGGSTKDVSSGFTCSPQQFTQAGRQTVTVTYSGKTCSFDVTVQEAARTVRGVGVVTLPSKTVYKVGEWLNTSGLTLRAYYTDGSSEDVANNYSASPQQLTRAGQQTITVSYGGKTCTFDVTVEEELRVTGIEVQSLPVNRTYTVGDTLNTTGLMLTVFTTGSNQTVNSGFTCSPERLTTEGIQTITVTYEGQRTTFTVEVRASNRGTPAPSTTPGTGLGSLTSPSPSATASAAPTSVPARRNTGVNGVVKLLFVVALAALLALIGYVWFLRRSGLTEDARDAEPDEGSRKNKTRGRH